MAPKAQPPIERFMEKIARTEAGCWEWTAYINNNGYGRFYINGKNALAHRWSYKHHVGPIADGLVIDHLCRNKACVNPEHLEPVTPPENTVRGVGPALKSATRWTQTHCREGHELTEENTYINGRERTCRTCKKANARAYYEKTREQTIERSRQWVAANRERAREHSREGQRRQRAKKKAA